MSDPITASTILLGAGGGVVVPFVNKVVGPAAEELGLLLSEGLRKFRLKKQLALFKEAHQMLADAGVDAKQVSLKLLVPLLENASLEDSPVLSTKWAALLANAANSNVSKEPHPSFVDTLRQLTPSQAKILDLIFEGHSEQRVQSSANPASGYYRKDMLFLKNESGLSMSELAFDIANLLRLDTCKDYMGMLENNLIEIAHASFPGKNTINTEDFVIQQYKIVGSVYGLEFVRACTAPVASSPGA
ncbi:Abi-alpha family protein [Hymenobacter sediminicola]|uniref:DUF4393 domain-containing protein n=1 Tax=Hymenobacter sediminicola TaxID=2761579 RepID=A0A7G7W2Z3_9BACT|nr:Abi-alpha family protein [Hymenobacter sediminicola]QNH60736.1 DUF4393 domain-containing protein [Hymenobacter sediminicola]